VERARNARDAPHLDTQPTVDLLLAMGTLYERSPTLSDCPHCCANIGDYSAHNSWRAYSIFSRKVRSRDICRCTLSTLWITVE
jgi:hypothetical protein